MGAQRDHPTERAAHPQSCHGCRHEATYGVIEGGTGITHRRGQCLRYSGARAEWPDGCRHYVERGR